MTRGFAHGAYADALTATLDRDDPPYVEGVPFPPGWHWLCFPEVVRLSDTGHDGHPRTGGFMPPVPLPRRMWGGNRMTFERPVASGQALERRSTIADVRFRDGAGGAMCIVTVRHEIHDARGLCTIEEHDVVYREATKPGAPPAKPRPAPAGAVWTRTVTPSPVLLFRFSALTMNSHRIHYDRRFAVEEEGYPGLVFHGPLTMILLMDLCRRELPDAVLAGFSVRATAPLYDDRPFGIHGVPGPTAGEARFWAMTPEGALAMDGTASFR
ncbi:MAG: MaoC family dehydratase N-terminal domain-containing protein [Gammaproteobacteria bacterium]|nr:MaoC family dehydratase N-terminal domain-containing protein [Gammaproteobacteria bacterium]